MSELGSKPRPAEPSPCGSSLSRAQAGIPGALHLFLIALIMARGCLAGTGQGKGIGGGAMPQELDQRRGNQDVFIVKNELTLLSPPPRDAKQLGAWPGLPVPSPA